MRIQDLNTTATETHVRAPASTKEVAAESGSESKQQGGARVSLSREARALSAQGAVDEAKVARLRASIENGSFEVRSKFIADKIVDGTSE